MTKELANKLIAHYEETIQKVQLLENISAIKEILIMTKTRNGICDCSNIKFNIDIYADEWVSSKSGKESMWAARPGQSDNKEEIINLLQIRVNILKTFK